MNRSTRERLPLLGGVLLLIVLLVGITPIVAQETTGSISGAVVDASGAALPNAKVEITGAGVRAMTLNTDALGNYQVGSVPVGSYDITVSAQGFSTTKKTAVGVVLGKNSRIDFKLEVGQITTNVVITADAAMVDTTSSSSSMTIDRSFFNTLGTGRSFADLVGAAAGARHEDKGGGYQIDGATGAENTFYLDGMEVTSIQGGVLGTSSSIPPEMVEQVQVKNGVMDAQYGGSMGGVVNAVVRSGTNSFHGQAGFYFNNDSMQARPRPVVRLNPDDDNLAQSQVLPQDSFSTWNPVFDLSGPIWKDKLFFFAGFMPTLTTTNRTSVFNDGTSAGFKRTDRQHYSVSKVDFNPWTKLRMNASFTWSPSYNRGVLPARGNNEFRSQDDPSAPWGDEGGYYAATTINGGADYLATNKLIFSFRGGVKRNNTNTGYGIPATTAIYYSGASTTLPPPDLQAPNGWISAAVPFTPYDVYERKNYNADVSYILNWHGQHNLKGGWSMNQLSDDVSTLSYPNGYYRYYWGLSYACITSQCSGHQTGTYGYYRYRLLGTFGSASSDNQGMYVQDNWRVNKHLNINLGIRSEREFLPSFGTESTAAAPPIEFSWSQKVSPRIGFAWDPKGNGKQRIYGSWGQFYDVMKYEMPRGSFGGDVWQEWYFSLDDPNVVKSNQGAPANPDSLPGKFFEKVNWRIPSNDPSQHLIEPNLKPVKQQMFDAGWEYSLNETSVLSVRYTNRRLIRTIEDTGFMGEGGETYLIANPGEGITTGASWTNLWLGDTGIPNTVKPMRHYDAVETRWDKRFSRNYAFVASYTWSRLYGNYSGLASSDEAGRDSPNVNRYYDMPWVYTDQSGKPAYGRLATDRPHTFKFWGSYMLKSKLGQTTLSPNIQLYSGTPMTTEVNVISSTPAMPYGRGDMGRTPWYHNFDLNLMHDFLPFKSHESMKIRFELSVFNVFNNSTVTDRYKTLSHSGDATNQIQFQNADGSANYGAYFQGWDAKALIKAQGLRTDPEYGMPISFQAPRSLRMQIAFFF